jgi:flagellar protein FliS
MSFDPRTAYRESAAHDPNPVDLVILLYEQAIEDLRRARAALQAGDVQGRTYEIGHAIAVVGQLQAVLDMDKGGEVARNLDRFYSLVLARVLEAQIKVSPEILEQQIDLLLSLREAWVEVERLALPTPAIPAVPAAPGERRSLGAEWRV